MALSLDQINKHKKSAPATAECPDKKQLLRPWQSFDKLGTQTRTVAAKEAVERARRMITTPAYRPIHRPVSSIQPKEIKTAIKAGSVLDFLNFLF